MRIPKSFFRLFAILALAVNVLAPTPAHSQASPAAVQLDRVPEHADLTQTLQLSKTLPQWVAPSRETGSLPDSTPIAIEVAVTRAPTVQAAFEQLLEDQQNPNSPRYHQWLTPQQLGEQYGPTQHDLDALSNWLTAQGFTLTGIAPSRVFVRATATAAVVGHAFKTQFRTYTVGDKSRFSVATDPSIPAAFSSIIGSIAGLTQIQFHPMSRIQPTAAKPNYTTKGGYHYVFPADFATIFDINPVYNASITGTGQHVAVIGESDIVASDITAFESISNLASNTPKTIIPPTTGVDPGVQSNSGDEGESDLDLQRVIGVAPGVTADFVISGTVAKVQGIDIAMRYEIETLLDPVMTLSYGECEADAGLSTTNTYNTLFSTGAAEGISIFISSDDSGAAGCDSSFQAAPTTQSLSINFLCSSSYVTCVGGTEFNDTASPSTYWNTSNSAGDESAIGYIPEGAWNETTVVGTSSTTYQVAASGGGASQFITKPSFQAGVGVPADGFRDVPDVAFPAADHDGYFGCEADVVFSSTQNGNCATGGGLIFSGTSAAAPGMAGVAALLNQKLGTGGTGTGQGNLNPLLYRLAALTSGNPFHDTTLASAGFSSCDVTTPSTCNNSTPSPTTLTGGLAGYGITTGFDLVTGWGSVDVNALLTAAASQPTLPATSTTLLATPTTITTAQTVVFSSTVTSASGTPTGTVQFLSNLVALGSPITLVNGTASTSAQTFATAGTYTISAIYSGSSSYATSAAPTLSLVVTSVTPPPTPTLTLSPSPATLNVVLGNSASDAITLTSTNFSGTEILGCSVAYNGTGTSTDLPSCSITTPTIPANGTATTTLSLSTTAAYGHSGPVASQHRSLALTGTALCGLLALFLPISPARRKNLRRVLALILTAASFAAISGCGGGGTKLTNPGTTPGSYTITVNGSGVVAASTTIALTVQN